MAFTATKTDHTVFGNERVWHGVITADAASGTVQIASGAVVQVHWSIKSMTTSNCRVRANATAAGTATVGLVGISGVASGDELYMSIYYR